MSDSTTSVRVDSDSDRAVLLSIEIYYALFIVAFVLFEVLSPKLTSYFNCRAQDPKSSCPLAEQVYGFGGWICPVLNASDDEIMEFCGLDALVYLRFLKLARKIAFMAILMSFGLLPIYATAIKPEGQTNSTSKALIARLAMANIHVNLDPNRLWAPVIAGCVITIYTLSLLMPEYKVYVSRRHEYLSRDSVQQYTVIMNDLPSHLRTHQSLQKYLDRLFPKMVDSVHMAMECKELETQVAKREYIRNALERAMVQAALSGNRPTTAFNRGKVDAIDHFTQLLDKLNISICAEIETLRSFQVRIHEAMNDDSLEDAVCVSSMHNTEEDMATFTDSIPVETMMTFMRPSAFVTFSTLQATQSALQMLQTDNPAQMTVRPAPDTAEIIWENLGGTLNTISSWQLASTLLSLVIIVLWSFPTIFVTTIGSADQWRSQLISINRTLEDHPWLIGFFKQFSPLGLAALTALSHYVFSALSRREGLASQTEVDASTFSKLVIFQFIQTFAVALLSGSANSLLPQLLESPYQFVTIFSEALAIQAWLFISYITILTGIGLTLKLFRAMSLITGFLYYCFAPRLTPRERRSPYKWLAPMSNIEPCPQSTLLPSYFLVLLLVFVFGPITPLVSYFAALYFFLSEIVYRRLFFFVYAPGRFTTGVYWPSMYKFIIRALYLSQVILIALMWVKVSDAWTNRVIANSSSNVSPSIFEEYAYAFAIAPSVVVSFLPLITYVVDHRIQTLYPRAARYLPLVDCCRIDAVRTNYTRIRASLDNHHDSSMYIQPALRSVIALRPEFTFAQAQRIFKPNHLQESHANYESMVEEA
ncbi:hypothetical protein THRCLA_04868 [Thraustotheca clavata]|uniref:Transmembrane protein n=1 Tax=Thraustotheca clavata TaxID=74557 RepID=A0A1V9ZYD6_9STRA|nr:hypothetical protein THRCLA_04868 [Thraustotheca clavata]